MTTGRERSCGSMRRRGPRAGERAWRVGHPGSQGQLGNEGHTPEEKLAFHTEGLRFLKMRSKTKLQKVISSTKQDPAFGAELPLRGEEGKRRKHSRVISSH